MLADVAKSQHMIAYGLVTAHASSSEDRSVDNSPSEPNVTMSDSGALLYRFLQPRLRKPYYRHADKKWQTCMAGA